MPHDDVANPAPGFPRHPEHRVGIDRADKRLTACFNAAIIADTRNALIVRETGYPPVAYFPPADVREDLLTPTDHQTYCPFKGYASYWTVTVNGRRAENAVWSYRQPYDETRELKCYYAFYRDRIDGVETAE